MFKERYHGANDYVEMTEGLDRSILANLGKGRRHRVLAAVSVLMALIVLAAWMASTPAAFQWLSRVAPPVARFLSPSSGSVEENGIRVEVAEVTREEDALLIHLTLEDLEGDRLNGKTAPSHWTCEQGLSSTIGSCTRRYDEETGLLHLFLTCNNPTKNIPDFDWERWVTIVIDDLYAITSPSTAQIPIPLTLTDSAELSYTLQDGTARLTEQLTTPVATIQEGLDITCMTVIGDELHVQVRTGQLSTYLEYRLILSGPHGEQLLMTRQDNSMDYICWVFDLRGRDIQECTLSAWVDPRQVIEGPWRIRVSPLTTE